LKSFEGLLGKNKKKKEEIKKKTIEKRERGVCQTHLYPKTERLKKCLKLCLANMPYERKNIFSLAKDGHAKHALMVRKWLSPTTWVRLLGMGPSPQT
jgi:hypothetical protein